jgi:hypothetical protein
MEVWAAHRRTGSVKMALDEVYKAWQKPKRAVGRVTVKRA